MKTLADLKRDATKYEWSLTSNSWFKEIPAFQKASRRVALVQSNKMAFKTIKDGKETLSWIDFPKASELFICCEETQQLLGVIIIMITRKCGDRPDHVMTYMLNKIEV